MFKIRKILITVSSVHNIITVNIMMFTKEIILLWTVRLKWQAIEDCVTSLAEISKTNSPNVKLHHLYSLNHVFSNKIKAKTKK